MCNTLEKNSLIWLPIKSYEGLYEVSDTGLVRSSDRFILGVDGITYHRKSRVLKSTQHKDLEYQIVSLWANNKGSSFYIHRLVCEAFHQNPEGKKEVNHIDGNRQNNHFTNLEWVTRIENASHAIATGLKTYTNKLTKQEFIDCLFSIIDGESYAQLSLRVPYKVPFLSVKVRQFAKELNLEAELDFSLMEQRIKRARINGAKNSR